MNQSALEKFLQGTADDRETRQSEELLAHRETIDADALQTTVDDSLIVSLRQEPTDHADDAQAIRLMTEQLQKIIPRPEITADEIRGLLEPSQSPAALGRIGKYEITQYLASGGMGLVFRATDSQLNREVCLKLLHPLRARSGEARTRFDRESRAIARLNCQRIMPILDLGTHGDLPWLVMPLLAGGSLRSLLLRDGPLAVPRAIQLATQIAEGLESAHQAQILHRDIKPDNLWVTPNGEVKLLDFGLARTADETAPITHEGTVLGTPSYMSPEQITGKPVDGRSDLFSLGVVLVEMLTGQSPFRKDNLFSTLMSVAADEVDFDKLDPHRQIPAPLRQLIERLLHKTAEQRPASATEVCRLLRGLSNSQPHTATIHAAVAPTRSRFRSWTVALAAAVAGFALCIAGLAIWNWNDRGTLVVETSDPQVQVQIRNEGVTVRDPLTDRTYEIRRGSTPLPSGVYQLELTDASNNLVFSSQTIAIRRGEQTIVTVHWKPAAPNNPSQPTPANDASSAPVTARSSGFIPALEPVPPEQIVDASFDLAARDRFAQLLTTLPALPLPEYFPKDHLGYDVNVRQPVPRSDIDAWSLELPATTPHGEAWHANADRTLFATRNKQLWIVDGLGQPRYLLPVPGPLIKFAFDNRHPNLIAVCSWLGEPRLGGVYSDAERQPYQIHVWRLSSAGAELLRSFAADNWLMAWDHGYRLIYQHQNNLVASRIDNGTTTMLTKLLDRGVHELSISPGGRFLATRTPAALNVIDLHRGQFVSSIRANGHVQWRDDDAALAVFAADNQFFEVWRPDRPEMLKRLEWDQIVNSPQPGNPPDPKTPLVLDPDFGRVALVSAAGDLDVRALENRRVGSVRMEGLRQLEHGSLQWNSDGSLSIQGTDAAYLWRPTDSEVHGNLSIATPPIMPPRLVAARFDEQLVAVRGDKVFLHVSWLQSSPGVGERGNNAVDSASLPSNLIRALEVKDLTTSHPGNLQLLSELDIRTLDEISPDGNWHFKITRPPGETICVQVELVNVNNGQSFLLPQMNEVRGKVTTQWSADSRYLYVLGWVSQQGPDGGGPRALPFVRAWDIQTAAEIHFDLALDSSMSLDPFVYRDGLLLRQSRDRRSPTTMTRMFWLPPSPQQVLEIECTDEQREHWNLVGTAGGELVFQRTAFADKPFQRIRAQIIDGKLVESPPHPMATADQLCLSGSGDLYCAILYDPRSVRKIDTVEGKRSISLENLDKYPATGIVERVSATGGAETRKPLATWKMSDVSQEILWHPDGRHLAIREKNSGFLHIFDSQTATWKAHYCEKHSRDVAPSLQPIESGWLLVGAERWEWLSHRGELEKSWVLGNLSTDPNLDPLANGFWVRADGSIAVGSVPGRLQMVYRQDNRVVVEPLQSFEQAPQRLSIPRFKVPPEATDTMGAGDK